MTKHELIYLAAEKTLETEDVKDGQPSVSSKHIDENRNTRTVTLKNNTTHKSKTYDFLAFSRLYQLFQ